MKICDLLQFNKTFYVNFVTISNKNYIFSLDLLNFSLPAGGILPIFLFVFVI